MMALRPATQDDAEQLSQLIGALAHFFFDTPDGAGSEKFVEAVTPQAMALYVVRPDVHYLIAEEDGAFCGAVGLREYRHLHHLFVAPKFQRRGIGGQLWRAVRDAAMAAGNPGKFTVNASLNAVPVYQRFGFTFVGGPQQGNGLLFQPMKLDYRADKAFAATPGP